MPSAKFDSGVTMCASSAGIFNIAASSAANTPIAANRWMYVSRMKRTRSETPTVALACARNDGAASGVA